MQALFSFAFWLFPCTFQDEMDFRLSDDQDLLRRTVREFAEAEIRPHVMEWDESQHFPMDLLPKLAELGLMGIPFPEQYGGSGMSAVDYCICIEEIARVCPAIALSVAAHNGLCTSHISMFGSDAQNAEFLPRLVSGKVLGAWGLTEAGAGSDAAGMRTTAVRQGQCWVLNGSKNFITHGAIGGVMVVIAVTDRTKGHRGISAFIVEHGTPGMTAGKKENKLGMRASDTSEVVFQDCRIPVSRLLGDEGQGFINTLQVLDSGRIGIAALSVGLAQGAHEAALGYAKERRQFGHAIAAFQAIRWKLADNATRIEAARLLTYRAAHLKDRGARTTRESSMAKLFASEIAVKAADDCVQIHGGYGFVKDYPAEKYFRDVKLLTIGEGTSEIQRLVIARQLLGQ
jgi:alkylation response protein AidB-like acyl-CoA dehydrogenase